MKRLRRLDSQAGAMSVIIAVTLGASFVVSALVIDVGLLYQERRQLQSGVDAAALAAAMDLAEGRGATVADTTARRYVTQNTNVAPDLVNVSFPQANQVMVAGRTTRDLFFARVFGRERSSVVAKASASHGLADRVANLAPIIVPLQFIAGHIGAGSPGTFELGQDRPSEPFNKTSTLVGTDIRYTISFANATTGTPDVVIWDPLPDGASYVPGSATEGGVYDPALKQVRWSFPAVGAGQNRTVLFYVHPNSGKNTGNLRNTAYLSRSDSTQVQSASDGGSATAQRAFFWLADFDGGSGGVPDYAQWIIGGYPKEVGVGSVANGEGVKASLRPALEARIFKDPSLILPIYDYTEGGGSPGTYHVVGFAEFVVTAFDLTGNPKTVTGYFTNGAVTSGAGGRSPVPDFGVRAIWLDS